MARKKTKGNEPRKNILTASLPAGKGASPFSDGPAILAMQSLFEVTHDFVISRRQGTSLNWT